MRKYIFKMVTVDHGEFFKEATSYDDTKTDQQNVTELAPMIQLGFFLMLQNVAGAEFKYWYVATSGVHGKMIGPVHNELSVKIDKHGKPQAVSSENLV